MPIPVKYLKSAESAIASYSYADIADGTGNIVFYGYDYNESGVKYYRLTQTAIFSQDIETTGDGFAAGVTGDNKSLDLDFDVTLNSPRIIKGDAKVIASFNNKITGGVMDAALLYKFRKWDGAAETFLASGSSMRISNNTVDTVTTIINIPRTHFKKGETIRLTVEDWSLAKQAGFAASGTTLTHDPKDRDGTVIIPSTDATDTSKLEVHIPFVLDL